MAMPRAKAVLCTNTSAATKLWSPGDGEVVDLLLAVGDDGHDSVPEDGALGSGGELRLEHGHAPARGRLRPLGAAEVAAGHGAAGGERLELGLAAEGADLAAEPVDLGGIGELELEAGAAGDAVADDAAAQAGVAPEAQEQVLDLGGPAAPTRRTR